MDETKKIRLNIGAGQTYIPGYINIDISSKADITFTKIFHRFHYMGVFKYFPPPLKSWCRRHLFNVVQKIDYGLIAIKKRDNEVSLNNKQAMIQQFDECLESRIRYGKGKLI